MAKETYKLPTPLNRSYLDHEINLSGKQMSVRSMPIKQLLFFVGGVLALIWLISATFVGKASGWHIFAVIVWWIIALAYFGSLTKTKELRINTVGAFLAYIPKHARRVFTRRSNNPTEFYSIVGIESVAEDGIISFTDGYIGQTFLVVGSASHLTFDEDRDKILDRNDLFWRKIPLGVEFIEVTTKEPQRVGRQIANLERRNQDLEIRDPDLVELLDEQYDILTNAVGGQYMSIHQYWLIKARTADILRQTMLVIQGEVEHSKLMLKEVMFLDRDETLQMLSVVYQGL